MTEAIDTIRNTCSRRSQEERAEKTPEQRLLKAERRANEDLPCARASPRTCVAGAHICPRILGIGTFVRMWCTVGIILKSNGGHGDDRKGHHFRHDRCRARQLSLCESWKTLLYQMRCRTPRGSVLCQRPAKAADKPHVISPRATLETSPARS